MGLFRGCKRPAMKLNANELAALLEAIAVTQEEELDCDGCLALVGRFAEAELSGKTPTEAVQVVRQHLAICGDCREEYETLLVALRDGAAGSDTEL